MSIAVPIAIHPCPSCGREFGVGAACQFCQQLNGAPSGVHLSSVGRRLGAHLLDGLLTIVTLGIGWLVWTLIIWKNGQSPGKQLLGMRVIDLRSGRSGNWGKMFFREVICKFFIIGLIGGLLIIPSLLGSIWLLWDRNKQELWDKMADTVVVNDPTSLMLDQHPQLSATSYVAPLPPPAPAAGQAAMTVHQDLSTAQDPAVYMRGDVAPEASGNAASPAAGNPARFCSSCGAAFEEEDAVFCGQCGAPRATA